MKRRLTLSILGIVAATLVLAGVGTLLFARVGARNAAEQELRSQADSTAELVGVGQSRISRITNDLDQYFCKGDPSGLNDRQKAAFNRTRTTVCASPDQSAVTDGVARLCSQPAERLGAAFNKEVNDSRKKFCGDANSQTLEEFQNVFCSATPNSPDGRVRSQINSAKRTLCARRAAGQQANNLQATLTKEEILLVEFRPDGSIVDGRLPDDIDPSLIDAKRLRNDETISGSVGSNVFAAAPVDTPVGPEQSVRAIVIERPANPIRDSVQWFLMAAGLTLALGVVVSWWLGRALTNPLRQATDVTKRIADGDLSSRLPERGKFDPEDPNPKRRDDLDELAHSINSMADSLERSRGLERQFLLSVSHDLRTPLTSIRGYAEAIADGAAPDPRGAASIIMGESRRLERLVKDLLDLAKLESRGFELSVVPVDIAEVASDSVDGFRREVDAAGLRIRTTDELSPVMAMADPDRLQQVIANLIENALKYASTTIAVSVFHDADRPRIEVADDGPGIAPEDLPHVFERLYVASHEPKRKETGSGLGLAIVRELVDLMGGTVRAEANPTGGARMVVELVPAPAAAPPPAPPAATPDPSSPPVVATE